MHCNAQDSGLFQLFIDYNLYGMNMISVGAVKFRRGDKDGRFLARYLCEQAKFCGVQGATDLGQYHKQCWLL